MLNYIWLGLVVGAVLIGGWNGRLPQVTEGALNMAKFAVMNLALPLAGVMALWLGIMRLAEKSGMVQWLSRMLRPILVRLFPDVPPNHPAMGSMVMNIAANMLGLSNAATPLGLRAMKDLESLNPHPGTATNSMCTFLAINTGSVQLIPVTAIAVLVANNAKDPSAIIGTAFLATVCAAVSAIIGVKFFERLPWFQLPRPTTAATTTPEPTTPPEPTIQPAPLTAGAILLLAAFGLGFALLFLRTAFPGLLGLEPEAGLRPDGPLVRVVKTLSLLAMPLLLSFFPLYAALRKIKVYEEFVEGAKEGFQVSIRIIPYLVAMLVAIGMFRGAGGIELLTAGLQPLMKLVHFPPELLPMALIRPLSGSGSLGVFTDLVKEFGPDSLLTRTAGTIYGSTETTFYVLAVYFGSANIKRTRHAVPAGLVADVAGIIASVIICRLVFA